MATTTKTTRTAMDAYMEHHQAILALLDRIRTTIVNHDDAPGEEGPNWGDVGDAAETRRVLQELSDRLHQEGEYATVACTRCGATFPAKGPGLVDHYWAAHR